MISYSIASFDMNISYDNNNHYNYDYIIWNNILSSYYITYDMSYTAFCIMSCYKISYDMIIYRE